MSKINRVGPWGHLGSADVRPFSPVPVDVAAASVNTYPVNCAGSDWPNQIGQIKFGRSVQLGTNLPSRGVISFGETISVTRSTAFLLFNFCYQATEDFCLKVVWSMIEPAGQVDRNLQWSYETLEGDIYSYDEPIASNGEITCNLKAAMFGRFRCRIQGYSNPPTPNVILTASITPVECPFLVT
jgi:hypothetical protein